MATTRRAVIDVGTNSIKLLVADVAGREVSPLLEESEQTRLGAGFFESNRLQPKAVAETARAVAAFAAKARNLKAVSTRVIATSAARDAVNQDELISAIEKAAGFKVEIISGEQEADLAFQGVNTDSELAQHALLLMDVGGGSTEFILGRAGEKQFRKSFRLGTVRLLEKLPHSDPPKAGELANSRKFVREFLEREVKTELAAALEEQKKSAAGQRLTQLVGTGGTATILARMEARMADYNRATIESTRLSAGRVRAHVEGLWSLPLAEREKVPGLPKSRADVILSGVVIYEGVMEVFGFSELRISTRGLRFAALLT